MEWLRYLSGGLAALSAALATVALTARPALAAGSALTPSAQTVQAGETINLSFTGFTTCTAPASLAVLWDQSPLSYDVVAGSLSSGDFTVEIVVPSSPVGSYLIAAGCTDGTGYDLQQRVVVHVVALSLSPQSVQAGNPVTMTGSGFTQCTDPAGSTAVVLSANGMPPVTASGSDGDFQQVITVPSGAPAGPYAVTAQCPAQPGGAPTSISVNVVSLTLSPSSGTPGTTVSVTGDGYTQCDQVQLQLLRDTTQDVATSSPIGPASGVFTAEVTVPSGATPGADYQVDAECYPVAAGSAAIAIEPFTVTTPVAPTSPASSSTSASPGSPSSSPTGPTPSPSSSGSPSVITGTSTQSPGRTGGLWVPVALAGGTGAGLILAGLLLVRALSMLHGQRGRSWVNKHLRVVAGTAGTVSADVEDRPGAASVSVGLEPHLDDLGNQRYEEVAR